MPKKKTHEEYVAELAIFKPNIQALGKYINSRTKILYRCNICGQEWEALPLRLLRKGACPKCSKTRKLTHEEYVDKVTKTNPNIEVIGKYINSRTKILHKCKICGREWETLPHYILEGHSCFKCAIRNLPKTHEEYIAEVAKINPNIEVVDNYINSHTKILHRCKIDKHTWLVKPCNILQGKGCPKCGYTHRRLSHKDFVTIIKETNPNIEILNTYVNARTPISCKCKIDGYEWVVNNPRNLYKYGCPVCHGNTVGLPPEYKNSIWASDKRDYFSKFLTENQMKTHLPGSRKSITVTCPDCGKTKQMTLHQLNKGEGIGCECGDGISYPNKFIYNFLKQLNIEYVSEYSPDWANKKRYDIYIPIFNCIIENHGEQHYKGWQGQKNNLNEQKKK
jgi:ribosomal protein S18